MAATTKPKGALNPQQLDFLKRYMSNDSETYGNAYRSAKAAGYSENYATDILQRAPWLQEKAGQAVVTTDEIIAGIKRETGGDKASDRLKAWELLGKTQRLFVDRVENSGEQKLTVEVVNYGSESAE